MTNDTTVSQRSTAETIRLIDQEAAERRSPIETLELDSLEAQARSALAAHGIDARTAGAVLAVVGEALEIPILDGETHQVDALWSAREMAWVDVAEIGVRLALRGEVTT